MNWLNDIELWLTDHQKFMAQSTLLAVSIGLLLYGLEKGLTWWEIRDGADSTKAGRSLKRQKSVESICWTLLSMVFFFGFLVRIELLPVNVWRSTALQFLSAIFIYTAVFVGAIFLKDFRRDKVIIDEKVNVRQDERAASLNQREDSQNLREKIQNERDVHDLEPVNVRQDVRENEQNDREEVQETRDTRLTKREGALNQ